MKILQFLPEKRCFSFNLLVTFLLLTFPCYSQETITLTTYYPSPLGVYKSLRLFPDLIDPTIGCSAKETLYYYETDNQIYFCDGHSWSPLGKDNDWELNGTDLYASNTSWKVGIGTSSPDYKLDVHGPIMASSIGSAPAVTPGHAGIYTSGNELYAFDGNGNSTLLSPHDPDTGEWIFYSKNVKTGKVIRVEMERLVKKIEELTGETFMTEISENHLSSASSEE